MNIVQKVCRLISFDYDEDVKIYLNRLSKSRSDILGNSTKVAWDSNIVSADGAHYHFWIPQTLKGDHNKKNRKAFLMQAKSAATWQGDPVSFSYSYKPKFEPVESQVFQNGVVLKLYPFISDTEALVGKYNDEPDLYKCSLGPDGNYYFNYQGLIIGLSDFTGEENATS